MLPRTFQRICARVVADHRCDFGIADFSRVNRIENRLQVRTSAGDTDQKP